MSLFDSFDLGDYETQEELEDILSEIRLEMETLRGYERGTLEKLKHLPPNEEEAQTLP